MSLETYGQRPVAWLDSIGVLDSHTQIVHAVWVDSTEIQLVNNRRAVVIHCPVSNAVLGSGVAPIAAMIQLGIPVRLGTDGSASNDTQNIWETLKFAACMARAVGLDPTILPPGDALSMAFGKRLLTVGSPADLIIVHINNPQNAPVGNFDSALVLGSPGSEVQTVLVGGKALLKDGELTIVDEELLLSECRQAVEALRRRAGFY
jgi:5-methylthioadenosine/S-adenosylhomocysteine deaminase